MQKMRDDLRKTTNNALTHRDSTYYIRGEFEYKSWEFLHNGKWIKVVRKRILKKQKISTGVKRYI